MSRSAHLDRLLCGADVLAPWSPLLKSTQLNARYAAALRLPEIAPRNRSAQPLRAALTVAALAC